MSTTTIKEIEAIATEIATANQQRNGQPQLVDLFVMAQALTAHERPPIDVDFDALLWALKWSSYDRPTGQPSMFNAMALALARAYGQEQDHGESECEFLERVFAVEGGTWPTTDDLYMINELFGRDPKHPCPAERGGAPKKYPYLDGWCQPYPDDDSDWITDEARDIITILVEHSDVLRKSDIDRIEQYVIAMRHTASTGVSLGDVIADFEARAREESYFGDRSVELKAHEAQNRTTQTF